jgi:type IV pilus assembly protein PilW
MIRVDMKLPMAVHQVSSLRRHGRHGASARGFSLIELMVALTIAGVLLLGMSAYFVSSSRNFSETERVSRQIENGRYAASLLAEEIRHAGFYGEVGNVVNLPVTSAIAMPTSLPLVCASSLVDVRAALPLPIQGLDVPGSTPTCLPDYVAGTDVLVVRRANTTTVSAASVAGTTNYYTQTAFCNTADPVFKVAQSGFTLQAKDCATTQPVRQLHTYIFYIAKCSIGTNADGTCKSTDPLVPTLKRAEPTSDGTFIYTPLVEGIENMQLEYGRDTSSDGAADAYTANPASIAEWAQVAAIKVNLLSRNTDPSPGFTDTKTYQLGLKADGSANNFAPGGAYRRHAYVEVIRVQNPSQRLEATFP